jgi:putative ABC transport system permease protein
MNDFVLIAKNLFRKKLRATLMLVSILIAFSIFGVVAGFERAFNAGADVAAADRLIVVNKINFTQPLPIAYFNRVRGTEGVLQATHLNWFGGYYQEAKNFLIVMAVEPETYTQVYDDQIDIPADARQAFVSERTGALVGSAMLKRWGWKVGDHVPIMSNIFTQKTGSRTWDFTIVGTFTPRKPNADTNFMVFQYEYFNETQNLGRDMIGWMALKTSSPAANESVAKAIDRMFANSFYETSTDTERAFNKAFAAQLGNIALIVALVVGAAFATILMIVGNTMVMAVRERTREIGILKTLGFTGGRILRLVLGESLLLALLGGVPGVALAALFAATMETRVGNFIPGFAVTPAIALVAVVLMLALGLATGLIPAINAMRLKIATALGRS